MVIVGNKADLQAKRAVSFEEAEELARHFGFKYYECSAKSGQSVEETFLELARMMKQKVIDAVTNETESPLELEGNQQQPVRRCCV